MHGTIFAELQKYVETKLGPPAWRQLLSAAGIEREAYSPFDIYPDTEVVALVSVASRITGAPAGALLEDFGEFIASDLLEMYWAAIDPTWRTLDVLEHAEETIHAIVRINHKGARPPYLEAQRTSPDEVLIVYKSPRRLCQVAKGISRGIARYYGEQVTVTDETCMHRGDADCRIRIRREA